MLIPLLNAWHCPGVNSIQSTNPDSRPLAYSYVRFSTPAQGKEGRDSLRRQKDAAKEYCEENNLKLVTDQNFYDKGKSGYFGKHLEADGQLKRFLDLAEAGAIPKGSYLIVERLDRVSRQSFFKAVDVINRILNAGIKLVTTFDNKLYDTHDIGLEKLLPMMFEFVGNNNESKKKQDHLLKSWKTKRKAILAGETVRLSRLPAWLEQNEKKQIVVTKIKAAAVERIFDLYVNQRKGHNVIHRILNLEGVLPISTVKQKSQPQPRWIKSYVIKILKNPAVIGLTHLYTVSYNETLKRKVRKQETVQPVKLYPPIIEESLFQQAQELIAAKSISPTGREGIVNLFNPDICRCIRCGSKMVMVSKSTKERWLRCSSNVDGNGCSNSSGYPYWDFERSFLRFVREMDYSAINRNPDANKNQLSQLLKEKETLQLAIDKNTQQTNNLFGFDVGLDATALPALRSRINQLSEDTAKLKNRLSQIHATMDGLQNDVHQIETMSDLAKHLENAQGEELKLLRRQIKQLIQQQIEQLVVFTYRNREDFRNFPEYEWIAFLKRNKLKIEQPHQKKLRAYYVKFRYLPGYRLVRWSNRYYKNQTVFSDEMSPALEHYISRINFKEQKS